MSINESTKLLRHVLKQVCKEIGNIKINKYTCYRIVNQKTYYVFRLSILIIKSKYVPLLSIAVPTENLTTLIIPATPPMATITKKPTQQTIDLNNPDSLEKLKEIIKQTKEEKLRKISFNNKNKILG